MIIDLHNGRVQFNGLNYQLKEVNVDDSVGVPQKSSPTIIPNIVNISFFTFDGNLTIVGI